MLKYNCFMIWDYVLGEIFIIFICWVNMGRVFIRGGNCCKGIIWVGNYI